MRNKLEYIQAIDKYLRGVLSKEDTAIFEKRYATDSQLREEVAKQKLLMEGIKRNALKASAMKGRKSYKKIKTLKTIGIGLAVVAITALSVYAFLKPESFPEEKETIQTNLGIESLENQGFTISTLSDTVIETENGIVLAIPSDAFETESGESVSGDITFEIKEAFDNADIMKAGLTTTSDGELLETGGMFFMEATHKGKKLRLKKGKEILSQLPNLQPEKEMQLYDGEKKADGTINWVNPKSFEKDLITVDITSLDFYPEGYVEEVSSPTKTILGKAIGDIPSANMTVEQARKLGHKYPTDWTEEDALKLGLITREYKKVKSKNLDVDKVYTDSLYYSFARLFKNDNSAESAKSEILWSVLPYLLKDKLKKDELLEKGWMYSEGPIVIKKSEAIKILGNRKSKKVSYFEALLYGNFNSIKQSDDFDDFIFEFSNVISSKYVNTEWLKRSNIKGLSWFVIAELKDSLICPSPSGINPAKVKVIWNKKFNNTILATKEFEERMKVIHESHQDRILQVYVSNLDKPLWYSDSIASHMDESTTQKFRRFYKQKKGGVNVKDKLANKLSNYFNKKHEEFTSKSATAFKEYQEKKQKLRKEFRGKQGAKVQEEVNRQFGVFVEEFETNLCEAYSQLNKKGDCKTRRVTTPLLTKIKTLGPKNIDRAVFEATRDRKTLNWTDPVTGKKAVIKYEPLKVTVLNTDKFDRIFMYLVPDKLNSFNRMEMNGKKEFNLPINELLNYEVKAIAYKGDSAFYAEIKSIKTGEYEIRLKPITKRELKRKLRKTKNSIEKDIKSDLNFYQEELVNKKREKKYKSDKELTLRIGKFLFPELDRSCILESIFDPNVQH
mgnify:CR=1 FL=1